MVEPRIFGGIDTELGGEGGREGRFIHRDESERATGWDAVRCWHPLIRQEGVLCSIVEHDGSKILENGEGVLVQEPHHAVTMPSDKELDHIRITLLQSLLVMERRRQRKNTGVIVLPALLSHVSHNKLCYSYYYQSLGVDDFVSSIFIRKSKKPEDASEKSGLTNTRKSPLSSGLVPEVLDNQVMFNPSVEPIERALIGLELVNNEDDNDSFSDDNLFSPC
eukprot:jgi/Psemu1/9813/gm1.9813_g